MIDYSLQDNSIDELIWSFIGTSPCPEDFRDYLRHAPESRLHLDEAIDRLIAIDNLESDGAEDERRYPAAIAEIEGMATDGHKVAQFHMGKILGKGIGVTADPDRSAGWYRAAVLQKESRSAINLAVFLEQSGRPEDIGYVKQLLHDAAAAGEVAAEFILAHQARTGYGETNNRPDLMKAFAGFHQVWEKGCVLSGYSIGRMLIMGDGVRSDVPLGREWVEKSALAGCDNAIIAMGMDAEFGRNQDKDLTAAMDWYRRGAERGSTECQHRLANLLLRGENGIKDGAQAVHWLRRAAVCGDSNAQRILGLVYLWGVDVVRNARFGYKWLTRAAEGGDSFAAYHLGKALYNEGPPQLETAARWLEKAALAGESQAQAILGNLYWSGRGVTIDHHAAHKWINLSSLQGDAYGLYLRGRLHYFGVAVPEDYVLAAHYFRKAAERGHAGGQTKLGWCYLNGEGVSRDVAEGMLWLSRAADQGNVEASAAIGFVLRDGIGVERNPGEASKWFLDAAERGDAPAQHALALLYAEGHGLVKDRTEARKWMEKSAAQGHGEAITWLKDADDNVMEIPSCGIGGPVCIAGADVADPEPESKMGRNELLEH